VRNRESHGNYSAVNRSSGAAGAYQLLPSTWANTARHMGRGDLAGVRPNLASPATQDAVAAALLHWQGRAPWGYAC
jgi:muramidase (phage lysozyme)